ncbi:MAG: adenosylcobinamide-GDP ribazoletransferase [Deltaproteobacteria bacterium]|nr:MAG: adenosylcobinamide-GDP ribazoletransferase [Deltaproteobacteria bacterium]
MRGLKNAMAFLTTLPITGAGSVNHAMLPWFPVVGLFIGLFWAGCDALFALFFPLPVRAVLDLLVLILITGGLHLDGLADAADGIMAHRGRERALEIMRDSRLGTWGAIALFSILMLNLAALSTLVTQDHAWRFFLLAPAYGRLAMLFGLRALPYGRPEGGMASHLFGHTNVTPYWTVALALISLAVYPASLAIVSNLLAAAAMFGIIRIYRTTLGCITGDMIGALGEITQMAFFIALTLGGVIV